MKFFSAKSSVSAREPSSVGAAAELRAAHFLEQHGLRVLERNWRVRGGEIDLICQHGEMCVFVEVRLRKHAGFGGAAASVTTAKQRRIVLAAQHYLAGRAELPCRFDVVLFDGPMAESAPEWIQNAFLAE